MKKECISVFKPEVARKLLKLQYRIIDIKPFKENPSKTFFIFKNEGDFEVDLQKLTSETK